MATATKNRGAKRAGKKSVKSSRFHQKLGALTYYQACRLLGDEGSRLIQQAGRTFDVVGDRDVYLGGDLYRVRVHDAEIEGGMAIATVTLSSDRKKGLAINCDRCEMPCPHLAAAFDFLLDAKTDLGLAMPPDEDVPLENLTVEELKARAMADRQKRPPRKPCGFGRSIVIRLGPIMSSPASPADALTGWRSDRAKAMTVFARALIFAPIDWEPANM